MRARAPIVVLTIALASLFVGPLIGAGPPLVGIAHASGCITNCLLNATTSVPISEGTVFVEQDNNSGRPPSDNSTGLIHVLPHLFQFANYTVHTITVLNLTLSVPASGARYVWKQWCEFCPAVLWTTNPMLRTNPMLYNYTGAASFVAQFDKRFKVSLSFADPSGQTINPPSSLTLTSAGSTTTLTNSSQWISASLWSISGVTWEGFPSQVLSPQTIDMRSGPVTTTILLPAYPETLLIVDTNNNPIAGVRVTVSFANSTSTSFTSDNNGKVNLGHIPEGSFTARVTYQGVDKTFSFTALNTPTNTVQLYVGGSTTSTTVSAVVLLTIFGIAFFLILLAIKVRRPAPPPTI